jgi:hypothetical protein
MSMPLVHNLSLVRRRRGGVRRRRPHAIFWAAPRNAGGAGPGPGHKVMYVDW